MIDVFKVDVGDGGILSLSHFDQDSIVGVNFCRTAPDVKFLEIVSYQFELVDWTM